MADTENTMRWPKILTVGAAFALLNLALIQTIPKLERLEPLLLFVLGGLVIAGWAARAAKASWVETVAGFAVGLAPTIDGQATLQLSLIVCGAGLFLAPIVSGPVRREPEVALPCNQVLRMVFAILATLGLLYTAAFGDWKLAVIFTAGTVAYFQVVTTSAAILMTFFGRVRFGAWVGAVVALAFVVSFCAALIFYQIELGGRELPTAAFSNAVATLRTAPSAWQR